MSQFKVHTNDLLMILMVLAISTVSDLLLKYRTSDFSISPLTLLSHNSLSDKNIFFLQFEGFTDKEH